jgi:hypothetical protein
MFSSFSSRAKIYLGIFAFFVAVVAVVRLLNLVDYSVGSRTGIISKLSSKGLACWTNEGQLALPNFTRGGARSGDIDNTFAFSVPDDAVWKQLQTLPPGSPVNLDYRQKLFPLAIAVPFLCERRTPYEITGVRPAPAYEPSPPVRP